MTWPANVLRTASAVAAVLIGTWPLFSRQQPTAGTEIAGSRISVYNLGTKTVDVVYRSDKLIEAPTWSPDGKFLLVNTGGDL
ncbi:MAG: hypothetical protein JOY54_09455, partial [Acidobacteriaceae bacterium]|nr:hypothetical protein [Acidobacteriaceae bacterium]